MFVSLQRCVWNSAISQETGSGGANCLGNAAPMVLDRIDLAILAQLASNARMSHVQLSQAVGLSTTACARRIRALEEGGVVIGYGTTFNLEALDLGTTVIVRISLDSQSKEALQAFETAIADCPSVVRCVLLSGSDDYLVIVTVSDIRDFESVHEMQLSRLPGVARMQSSFALREVVSHALPPALFARPRPGANNRR